MNIFSQNRILKWNVSIMVILILLACSLMGILTVVFLKSLITYTDDTYSYHKSYYIAKAWLELALTEIDNSAMWFSHDIYSGDVINSGNFECVWCHFTSHILWRSKLISNDFWENTECTQSGALILQPWQSMTIPMFYDNASSFEKIFSNEDYIKLLWDNREHLGLQKISGDGILNIWVIFQTWSLTGDISWEYLYMTGMEINGNLFFNYFNKFLSMYGDNLRSNENYYPYIIISNNSENSTIKFCIKDNDNNLWPTTKYFISSLWEYMWKTVWLQAIYAQPTPSFFINPYSSYWWDWSSLYMQNENYY